MSFLSSEFLANYAGIRPKFAGPLFEWVYYTKYCRWIEELKRRETWAETVARVVEYNVGLYSGHKTKEELIPEAELMFDNIFHLKTYPAGRSLWIAGTKTVEAFAEANLNCCMEVIDSIEAFCDLFHLLMVGAGVGFRVLKEDVAKLPNFNTNIEIEHIYNPVLGKKVENTYMRPWHDIEESEVIGRTQTYSHHFMVIGDSKGGWVEALRLFLNKASKTTKPFKLKIHYSYIRPAGERIKIFGGRAAGHEGLMEMFEKLNQLIKQCDGKLTPVAAMDFANIIAQNVVVGGGRRSAQIALGSEDDDEFINAKVDLPSNLNHRRMSNNSIVVKSKPTKNKIDNILKRVRESWEPGFLNFEAASKRRPWFAATNPCNEILGADRGNCNLSGSFITSHIEDSKLNWESLEASHRLATRIGMRQTNITLSLPKWDFVHKRDRLVGVSITGLMRAFDVLGWTYDSEEAITLYQSLRMWANDEADKYAYEMRIPRPLLVTTCKPEGTITLLSDAMSCGLHRSYAPYYIRRIKLSKIDPVCKVFKYLGIDSEQDTKKPDRVVFSFPIDSGAPIAANDESAKDQLNRYLLLMKNYVDHNASNTITVGPNEWEGLGDMIYENWDDIVGVAIANKDLSENANYDQLPYEAITKEKYEQMKSTFPDLSNCLELINKAEQGIEFEYEEDDGNIATTATECSGGVCGVR